MPYAANIIQAQATAEETSSPSQNRVSTRGNHPSTSRNQSSVAPGIGTAVRRPQPTASIANARTPIRRPQLPHAQHAIHQQHDGTDIAHSTEGLLDEEFDDFGCGLDTLLRLANSA